MAVVADPFDADSARLARDAHRRADRLGARRRRESSPSDRPPRREPAGDRLGAAGRRRRTAARATGVDNLSYVSISEDASPVVRLVHSTVYDALRAGASDIHLESTAGGPRGALPHRRRAGAHRRRSAAPRSPNRSSRASRSCPSSTSPSAACRRTGASRSRSTSADRFPRVDHAEHLRRGRGAARARQAGADRAHERPAARHARVSIRASWSERAPPERAALRHAAGHRADRQRQDDDAVRGDLRDPDRPRQDRHHRGSGRVSAAGRAADSRSTKRRA